MVAVDEVGDQHMGVEVRITGPRGAVTERGADETFRLRDVHCRLVPARPCRLGLEHTYRGSDRSVVRVANLVRSFGIAQREQQDTDFGAQKVASNPGTLGAPCAGSVAHPSRVAAARARVERLGIDLADTVRAASRAPVHSPGASFAPV